MTETQPANAPVQRAGIAVKPVIAGVAIALSLTASAALAVMQMRFASGYVEIGEGTRVAVEVAATVSTREKGLSGKESLRPDEGMLFVFEQAGAYQFWMKDMRFPIDILWIKDGMIADITTDAAVPAPDGVLATYFPKVPVDHVLEVNAGFSKAHGLRIGTPVTIHVDKGKKVR